MHICTVFSSSLGCFGLGKGETCDRLQMLQKGWCPSRCYDGCWMDVIALKHDTEDAPFLESDACMEV